jgi:hypothetical protein
LDETTLDELVFRQNVIRKNVVLVLLDKKSLDEMSLDETSLDKTALYQFGIFPVLVRCAEKNLATLLPSFKLFYSPKDVQVVIFWLGFGSAFCYKKVYRTTGTFCKSF